LDWQIGPRRFAFTVETFLLSFLLPNLYLHAVSTNDIRRIKITAHSGGLVQQLSLNVVPAQSVKTVEERNHKLPSRAADQFGIRGLARVSSTESGHILPGATSIYMLYMIRCSSEPPSFKRRIKILNDFPSTLTPEGTTLLAIDSTRITMHQRTFFQLPAPFQFDLSSLS